MKAIEKRLAVLEDCEGLGSNKMTIFINQFSGETTGARDIGGTIWPRLPDESLDDFERRLMEIVPRPKGAYRLIAFVSASDDGSADFGLL